MRCVVLGTGLVGAAVDAELAARGIERIVLSHAKMQQSISLAAERHVRAGDVVVNAAAMTGVDACEDRAEEAIRVNGEEPGLLARLCRERGARLVHLSTDAVLDVTNVYARSKALGEERVRAAMPDALVLRIAWVFGPHPKRSDFVRFVVTSLREKGMVDAATDMVGSPTYTLDAARAIVHAAEGGVTGVHAFVNEPSISRHDLALRIQRAWDAPGEVRGVRMEHFSFRARRPRDTSMRATLDAWHRPMTLDACLADYRARWP